MKRPTKDDCAASDSSANIYMPCFRVPHSPEWANYTKREAAGGSESLDHSEDLLKSGISLIMD